MYKDKNYIRRRVAQAFLAAHRMARKIERADHRNMVINRLEEICLHTEGYAEQGYDDPSSGFIATGNWNTIDGFAVTGPSPRNVDRVTVSDLPKRLGDIFEKLGIEIEWSDEWSTCEECSKLVRTQPDSHFWTPSYKVVGECSFLCLSCAQDHE